MIAFTEIPKAIPISNTYKQGIYTVSDKNEFTGTAKLITRDNVTILIIIDSNGIPKFYKRFDTVNQDVDLGTIKYGDIIVIVGSGEIASNFNY
jgi:hypothetical protein